MVLPDVLTISEAARSYPHLARSVWSQGFQPSRWWWCGFCFRCVRESDITIALSVEEFGGWGIVCPLCDSEQLFWWHGWPSRLLDDWRAEPEEGKVYPLPDRLRVNPRRGARGGHKGGEASPSVPEVPARDNSG